MWGKYTIKEMKNILIMHFLYMIMVKINMKGPHPKEYGHINQINVFKKTVRKIKTGK